MQGSILVVAGVSVHQTRHVLLTSMDDTNTDRVSFNREDTRTRKSLSCLTREISEQHQIRLNLGQDDCLFGWLPAVSKTCVIS